MTRPQFTSHAEEIKAARAAAAVDAMMGADLDRAPGNTHADYAKPEPAPDNRRFLGKLCLVLSACIIVVLLMIGVQP